MLWRLRQFIRGLQSSGKKDLSYLLAHAPTQGTLAEQVEWTASLVEWVRTDFEGQITPASRVRFILQLLERNPEWKSGVAKVLRGLLRETRHVRLYTDVGVPSYPTFWREWSSRLIRVFIPEYDDPSQLAGVVARIFYDDNDSRWLSELQENTWDELGALLRTDLPSDEALIDKLPSQILESLLVLSARSLGICVREDVERRTPDFSYLDHPLFRFNDRVLELQVVLRNGGAVGGLTQGMKADLGDARKLLQSVRAHLETTGVTLDLVYQMDRLRQDLVRMHRLIQLLEQSLDPHPDKKIFPGFIIEMVQGHLNDGDFQSLLAKNFGLLSRKIVERTGHTGEHYITQNRQEYFAMLWTAAGGGALTALTAYLKYLPGSTESWPLFAEYVYNSTNYSLSFLIMHLLGFKLATKQPSMTAAALASKLKEDSSAEQDDDSFVDEIAKICRSQFAAVVGNLAAVIPAAWALDALFFWHSGTHFLAPPQAMKTFRSIDILNSGTLFFAFFTGLLLWLSSMISGWVENASVYSRFPEMMRSHPLLIWLLGKKRAQAWASSYLENVSGLVGSIALGCLLAATPVLGQFFGMPLDVRHVTLTTGSLTFAASSLGWENIGADLWISALIGIACIGTLNFVVSFVMALLIAMRAKDLPARRVKTLLARASRRLLLKPWTFLTPP